MLYDAFISHATEDKADVARPLAERLKRRRVEVWYDEFTLRPGASLRQSIDHGLAKSRYGIVILSPNFFGKGWPEWELNGLVQRHLEGSQRVLLPIWHQVTREMVASYSPSLADIVAIKSDMGLDEVVRQILKVIQPEESALVTARNLIIGRGYEPPVISDDWWLDVIEFTHWQDNQRWCLPIWRMTEHSTTRGEDLAWTVMQHLWQQEAESRPITQLTPPDEVECFIRSQPGLLEVCTKMPEDLLEFAPQLALRGCAGTIEPVIEEAYKRSLRSAELQRAQKSTFGSGLTVNGLSPACDECFALRHPTFGDYKPGTIACYFGQGSGAGLGPHTRAFTPLEYALWFLSKRSDWMPRKQHAFLLKGMKLWAVWPWSPSGREVRHLKKAGALWSLLFDSYEGRKRFKLSADARADLEGRIGLARRQLRLPESASQLVERFLDEGFIEHWFKQMAEMRSKHSKPRKSVSR